MTDSTQTLEFPAVRGHDVTAVCDGGEVTSDAGVLLLKQADTRVGLTARLVAGRVPVGPTHYLGSLLFGPTCVCRGSPCGKMPGRPSSGRPTHYIRRSEKLMNGAIGRHVGGRPGAGRGDGSFMNNPG
jgi:hypothetical protein